MSSDVAEQYDKQRRQQYHQGNLSMGQDKQPGEAAEILSALSQVEDLPIDAQSDPVMGQLVSRLTSTANLSAEQVRSNEWVREYIMVLYLCKFPRADGAHGPWRALGHDDLDAEREPLDPEKRLEIEAFISMSKLALSRSEGFRAVEESTRNVSESIVNEESTRNVSESIVNEQEQGGSGGGILGKMGLR